MPPLLFWLFAFGMLFFGLLVVLLRNPVASALSLAASFLALAALFISLDAFLIGTIQILVYAGAVMVLFLFIIMLLDLKAERSRKPNLAALIGGGLVITAFIAQLVGVVQAFSPGRQPFPGLPRPTDDVRHIGAATFTGFNLQLQIVAALVLVATIGVVILSKRQLK